LLDTQFSPWPSFTDQEADAVVRVLKSNRVNYWTGDECKTFEREFATWAGAKHAVAMANGTLALDVAWPVFGIGAGDEVICTPRSFQASASTVAMAGARPVFADVDRDSQNITPESTAPLIGKNTRAILMVHFAGWPCDMPGFRELADQHGLKLIEDCAQAHGASIDGRSVGTFGDLSAWSFCQDKIMTTGGEGGMVTTDDDETWQAVWSHKDHGKSWDAVFNREHEAGSRRVHESWGSNWRLTEMQAAIGRIQLTRMPEWHAARRRNALRLLDAFSGLEALRCPLPSAGIEHAWYKLHAFVRPEALANGWTRDRVLQTISDLGVPCYRGASEIYREKSFVDSGLAPPQRLPNAAELAETALMFLVHPTLSDGEIDRTVDTVAKVMRQATR
jgi:dTDP-4-amino-4,6-dideoxygalactose transaminase